MNALCLLLLLGVGGAGAEAAAPAADAKRPAEKPAVRVLTDPRVELICIVFRLAGHPEYSQGRIRSYSDAVEQHFGAYRSHAVVKLAQKLRRTRGVSYDACMSMAIHLTDAEKIAERVPFAPQPAGLDGRWVPPEAREFLRELRNFATESRFAEFFAAQRPLYAVAEKRITELLDKQAHLEWFPEYFGPRKGATFTLAVALLNGPSNYGARCLLPDGTEELYCVLGAWESDGDGRPTFGRGVLDTVVHEFCHSYTNAIIDRHAAKLKPAGEKLFAQVSAAMSRQAYGQWKTMLYESLVRACTIRYLQRHQGPLAGWFRALEDQQRQFRWIGELATLLGEYEQHREQYPTLEDFAPQIVRFFNDQAEKASGGK